MKNNKYSSFIKLGAFALLLISLIPLKALKAENSSDEKECTTSDTCFEKKITFPDLELSLNGTSLFRYYGFKVYSAAFYTKSAIRSTKQALLPKDKYLVLHYHRSLNKDDIIKNSNYILQKNPHISLDKIKNNIDKLYSYFENVKDGDRFTLLYKENEGLTLFFNGIKKTTIKSKNLQKAYFGIWLSQFSVGESFTKRLLRP